MFIKKLYLLLFIFLFSNLQLLASTISFSGDHVKGQVLVPYKKVSLNSVLTIGVQFDIDKDWHIYWVNPGDSGAEFKMTPELDQSGKESGLSIHKIYWPAPKRIPLKELTNFGYENSVLFPVEVKLNKNVASHRVKLEWLVCKIECIPGFANINLDFVIAEKSESTKNSQQNKLAEAIRLLPQPMSKQIQYSLENTKVTFFVPMKLFSTNEILDIENNINLLDAFFSNPGVTHNHMKPTFELLNQELLIHMQLDENFDFTSFEKFDPTSEVVLNTKNKSFAFSLSTTKLSGANLENSSAAISTDKSTSIDKIGFITSLIFAFLGGLILNLMPCVFPVLSMKILSFVDDNPKQLKVSGWMYTLGVLASFATLAIVLLSLRSLGENYGWGFQMQSPVFVSMIAVLFFILGLNFYGYFEFGGSFAQASQVLSGQKNKFAAFVTGVLAVVVATPCTAPFMGSALGASLFLPPFLSFFIFIALGLGLAAPFLALSYAPKLLKKLPRPGRWMETLKQFFAFPMFLTSLWLIWILEQQTSFETILNLLLLFLALIFLIWWPWTFFKEKYRLFLALLLIVIFAKSLHDDKESKANTSALNQVKESLWKPFSPDAVEQAQAAGQSVFIDFTAKWCITCQVNKRTVLRTQEIESIFIENNVELFEADWTKQDSIITKTLESFGRRSVPVYVYYHNRNQSQPILLPELLTKEMIKDLFTKKEN